MIRISNIKIYEDIPDSDVINATLAKYKISKEDILYCCISKKSVDARKKDDVHYSYSIDFKLKNENKLLKNKNISKIKELEFPKFDIKKEKKFNPVIIGAGPAGLFSALTFVQNGYKPIVIEQGEQVEERKKTVDTFTNTGVLNAFSNVQFGEGGAGTFSDGKLNTLVKDKNLRGTRVLELFVKFGAPKEILYDSHPHIGTDILRNVVKNMHEEIISLGGKFYFDTKLTNIKIKNNKVSDIELNHNTWLKTDYLVLAIGHSARDTFEMLYEKNIPMHSKPFAVGVRIEHEKELIDNSQYGDLKRYLPPASYKLTYQTKEKRGVYTFCMCPGGFVVNSSSEKNRLVINGMSNYKRESSSSNSAVIVTISPKDFGDKPLDGMYYQRALEEQAYKIKNGKIPSCLFVFSFFIFS